MPDDLSPVTNAFDDIDPQTPAPEAPTPHVNAFDEFPDLAEGKSSATGAFLTHAARGIVPVVGGLAGAGAGAEIGAAVGAFGGPVGAAVGGLVGGIGGFFGGAAIAGEGQDWAIHQVPDSWQEAIGQSDRQQRLQEQQHGIASFLGGTAPFILTATPGAFTLKGAKLAADATTFQRLMANPVTGRVFGGAAMGGMELAQEEIHDGTPDWAKVGISTGFGLFFNRPTRFGEYVSGIGAAPARAVATPFRGAAFGSYMLRSPLDIPREGVLIPTEPTIAQTADVGVMGSGITESTFHGGQEQSDATRTTAQNMAADEQASLGALPAPDLDGIARRLDPDAFTQNDELLGRRDSLRQWIADASNPSASAFDDLASKRSEVEAALRYANPRSPDARNLRAQLAELNLQEQEMLRRREAWESGAHVDTPDILLARQHLMDTEHALWDLGPRISAARRRAAEHAGQIKEAPTIEAAPTEPEPPGAAPSAESPVPPVKPIAAQRADIIADRTAALVAAGWSHEEAVANATVEAHYYETLAARFEGKIGTVEELYRARAAEVRGPQAAVRAAPAPTVAATPTEAPVAVPAALQAARAAADTALGSEHARWMGGEDFHKEGTNPREAYVEAMRTVPAAMRDRYFVHGIDSTRGGTRAEALEGMLRDKPESLNAGPVLPTHEEAATGVAATRTGAPYLLIFDRSKSFSDGPVFTIVNTRDAAIVEKVKAAFPGERIVSPEEAAKIMRGEADATAPALGPRPRVRSPADIAREEGVKTVRQVKAIQDAELGALADWQAAKRAAERTERELAQDRDLFQSKPWELPARTPLGGLSRMLQERSAGILSPEDTAHGARFSSPEGKAYAEQLDQQRKVWAQVNAEREIIRHYQERLREPGITDEGVFRLQRRIQQRREKLAAFEATAATLGVDPNAPFPPDIRHMAAHGEFFGDEKYAHRSFAPEGYPFTPDHDFHNPEHWMEPPAPEELFQTAQGKIRLTPNGRAILTRMRSADASTFMHETAHDWLRQLLEDSLHPQAPDQLKADAAIVRKWLQRGDDWTGFKADGKVDRAPHETFARTFEQYLREGVAPTPGLATVFAKFKEWLTKIYDTVSKLGAPISEDIRGVFDRMLAIEPQRTVHSAEAERTPSLATIHERDATETEPHEAEAVGDRVVAERDRQIAEKHPEIADAATAETAAEPAAETGDGATGLPEIRPAGGEPGAVTPTDAGGVGSGAVEPGGGNAVPKGDVLSDRRGERERRSEPGTASGTEQVAPKPAVNFAEDGETRSVDLAGNIRVENLTDQENIVQSIHDSADRNDEFRAVRGGMTKGRMSLLADSMMLKPEEMDEEVLLKLFGDTENLGAKILAARRLVVQSAGVVSDLMKTAAETGLDHDVAALGVAIARHDLIQATLAGVTAEWGRAGNAFHSLLEGWEKAQDVNQLLKDNLGRDLFQLRMIAKLGKSLDTPGKISKFLRDARERTFGRMVLEYWINGLISGISTHVTYMVGNAVLAAEKAGPETAAAWAIGALRAGAGRTGERVRIGEVGAQFRGALTELPAAAQSALEAYRTGATTLLPGETARPLMPFQGDTSLTLARNMTNAPVTWGDVRADAYSMIQGMRDGLVASGALVQAGGVAGAPLVGLHYSPLGQLPDIAYRGVPVLPLGTLARFPSRNVAAIHSTFRSINYSMEINALAYRRATEEGMTGTAFSARVADLRQNPTEEMMTGARAKATDLTLMGQGGAFVNALSKLTNIEVGGFPVLKFVDPFVHISANVLNQTLLQRTPIGLLSSEIRADLAGRNGNVAQDTAMAKMLVGSAISVGMMGLAAQGLASGSGPSDPHKAAMWRLAGNQAHSVRIGDIWYDVHRLGPMGLLASVASDLYDVSHQIGKEDADVVGKSLMHAFAQNILDESFMRGPSDLIKAVSEPDRYGASYVRTFLSSFMPYSVGMAQMARATDLYSRQARTIMDTIRSRTPGLSDALFARRDIWGEPMPSGEALGGSAFSAIYERHMSTDPVNLAMLALGIGPAPVDRTIRNVKLTDQQYDDFAKLAGRSTKMRLDAIVRSPDYSTWTNPIRHEVIEEVLRQSREAARGLMMMKYPQIARDAAKFQINRKMGEPVPIP